MGLGPSPLSLPQLPKATAPVLTSALGTFLIGLVLLGALSPRSSSEVSVRESAWLGLDLRLREGSSPGFRGGKENEGPGVALVVCLLVF